MLTVEGMDDIEIIRCPICGAVDPFDLGDEENEYQYECQACGTEFAILHGPKDNGPEDDGE